MELKVVNTKGESQVAFAASDDLFGREFNEALVHQVVTAYFANARSANRAQLGRDNVKHSTKKPWRQKGTGRARAGMSSSPLWRGGGRAFPNSPDENFSHKVNRKMYRAGIATIVSQLVREERLLVVDSFALEAPKTKAFAQKLAEMQLDNVLIVTKELDENLYLASRNLPHVLVLEATQVDPVSLVRFKKVVFTRDALQAFEELFA
ncbi:MULTISPECIES: 50S ribosomal protein L4 [Deefgea]|uniref:Large ribosomal subunit protein uL4 n=1 Tax=Deefgea chitinilytica TaxID=570276 RepID=A0ABS2CCI9_9NEIS|nr:MULTISPECIES: 50S ribosomal protein L4 [Deefgea]MBM5571850.1 50S ribosomal protein L4 [Deefgea chitinilytica]MBM9889085.1 50S ribosomal protein L4 [Deefgea sp. CFH1-16]